MDLPVRGYRLPWYALCALLLPAPVFGQSTIYQTRRAAASHRDTAAHYLAVVANQVGGENSTTGTVSLYDRDTTTLIWSLEFGGPVHAAAAPDGHALYVGVRGKNPGVSVIDVQAGAVQSFIPLSNGPYSIAWATGAGGVERVLLSDYTTEAITLIDPSTNSVASRVACPSVPKALVHNSCNGTTYAGMSAGEIPPRICVVSGAFDSGSALSIPVDSRYIETLAVLDNGAEGLIVATWPSGGTYLNVALEPQGTAAKSYEVPSLNGVYPVAVHPEDGTILYGVTADGLGRYELSFAAGGTPQFALRAAAAGGFLAVDSAYVYQGIGGSCSSLEGPVTCTVGFTIVDALTLEPRAQNASIVPAGASTPSGSPAPQALHQVVPLEYRKSMPSRRTGPV